MKDITHGKRIGSIKTTIFALTNLIKNTKEHERDNRKDERGYGRSLGRAQVVRQDANMTVPARPSSCGNLFLS